MSVRKLDLYHPDGRLKGSYVYMLLCQEGESPIYVKAGMSDRPTRRFSSLRAGCPVAPKIMAVCEVRSRNHAKRIEAALHLAFQPWHAHLEWYRVPFEDKKRFNLSWQPVFRQWSEEGWRLEWTQISAQALASRLDANANLFRSNFMRRGRAYRDFARHRSCES